MSKRLADARTIVMNPDPSDPNSPVPPDDPRLTRLEEHAAFTEHTVEQLSTEIAELNRRLAETARRIQALEDRLTRLVEALANTDSSAH
jgi:uncharacterized coiled-coil protein SlyX